MTMTTLCSKCGFNNPPGMRFCGNCGAQLSDTVAPPPTTPTSDTISPQMGAMMGADLLERFRQAGMAAAGQRRNVTVLFVDLSGYTQLAEKLDSEDLYDLIQQYIEILANDVYKYEGMVDKFTGDGLMALFGAPIAHENNAELAVRSALDMIADVDQLSQKLKESLGVELRVHIGLNAGSVIVGGIGSNLLMNYTAIGDTVNLAQRLEDSAPAGNVFVSDSVYRQTQALFDYVPSPTLRLKGIARPIHGH
ncbi:MAG: adenylate/guanylate cyclase domain-containing protein, partial [Chloroflexota bacterium]